MVVIMSLKSIEQRYYKSLGRESAYITIVKDSVARATSLKTFNLNSSSLHKRNILKYEYLIRIEKVLQENLLKRITLARESNRIRNKKERELLFN